MVDFRLGMALMSIVNWLSKRNLLLCPESAGRDRPEVAASSRKAMVSIVTPSTSY